MPEVSSSRNDVVVAQPPETSDSDVNQAPPSDTPDLPSTDHGPVDQIRAGPQSPWEGFVGGQGLAPRELAQGRDGEGIDLFDGGFVGPDDIEAVDADQPASIPSQGSDPLQAVEPGVYGEVDLAAHPVRAENADRAIDAVNQRVASGEIPEDKADEAILLLFGAMTQNDRPPAEGLPDANFHNVAGAGDRSGVLWLSKDPFGADALNDPDRAIETFLSGNEDFAGVSQMLSEGQSMAEIAEATGLPTHREHYRQVAPLADAALSEVDEVALQETIASDPGLRDQRTTEAWLPVLENLDMSDKDEVVTTLSQFYTEQFGMNDAQLASLFAQMEVEIGENFQFTTELSSGSQYNGREDLGNTQPGDGPRFKGRGFLQITGRGNYDRMDDLLSEALGRPIDLEANPESAADPQLAAFITGIGFTGRLPGDDEVVASRTFTQSRPISNYIPDDTEGAPTREQAYDARRVVNSTDKANAIADRTLELYEELMAE